MASVKHTMEEILHYVLQDLVGKKVRLRGDEFATLEKVGWDIVEPDPDDPWALVGERYLGLWVEGRQTPYRVYDLLDEIEIEIKEEEEKEQGEDG